jgi:protein-S-isoprenylcysteine O-methyltransferase Ste14
MIGTVLFCLGLVLEIWAIHCFIRTKAIEEAYRRAEYIRTMRSKGVRDKIAFISDAPGMEAANKAITERFFKKLITGGPYVYMRNPIITALYIMQIAESLLLNSEVAFTLFGAFLLSNMIYFPFTEERILEKRFGKLYQKYKREVPRWIPRLTPWVYSRASSSKISP